MFRCFNFWLHGLATLPIIGTAYGFGPFGFFFVRVSKTGF